MSAIGQTGTVSAAPSTDPSGTPPSTGQAANGQQEQGQQTPQTQQDGFWGRFPTVPEEQRAALEPHLKQVQAYVTRMEQAYVAPFKGYTPQQVRGLANFAKAFDAKPLETFEAIAADLQKKGVIHQDLDIQALSAVIRGQDPPEELEGPEGGGSEVVDDGAGDPWEQAPPWAQEIRARFQAQEQAEQEQARTIQQQKEDAVLDQQITTLKSRLKEAGYPDAYLQNKDLDKDLIARFIVHNGSAERVLNEMKNLRTTLLQGVVQPDDDNPVDLPNGVPRSGSTTQRRAKQNPRDPFAQASAGAEQHLRSALRSTQQNG